MAAVNLRTMPFIVVHREHGMWTGTLPSGKPVASPSDARIRQEARVEGAAVRFEDMKAGGR